MDSRTSIKEKSVYYHTSSPVDWDWGQPPASNYMFRLDGVIMRGYSIQGVYAEREFPFSSSNDIDVDAQLQIEMDAWEMISEIDAYSLDLD
jgi:hypothetical protein